jgi:hypothetical protein
MWYAISSAEKMREKSVIDLCILGLVLMTSACFIESVAQDYLCSGVISPGVATLGAPVELGCSFISRPCL